MARCTVLSVNGGSGLTRCVATFFLGDVGVACGEASITICFLRATGVGVALGAAIVCGGTAGGEARSGAASVAGRFKCRTGQPVPGVRGALASGKLMMILGLDVLTASLGRAVGCVVCNRAGKRNLMR